MLFLDFLS